MNKTWIPVLILILVVAIAVLVVFTRRSPQPAIFGWLFASRSVFGGAPATPAAPSLYIDKQCALTSSDLADFEHTAATRPTAAAIILALNRVPIEAKGLVSYIPNRTQLIVLHYALQLNVARDYFKYTPFAFDLSLDPLPGETEPTWRRELDENLAIYKNVFAPATEIGEPGGKWRLSICPSIAAADTQGARPTEVAVNAATDLPAEIDKLAVSARHGRINVSKIVESTTPQAPITVLFLMAPIVGAPPANTKTRFDPKIKTLLGYTLWTDNRQPAIRELLGALLNKENILNVLNPLRHTNHFGLFAVRIELDHRGRPWRTGIFEALSGADHIENFPAKVADAIRACLGGVRRIGARQSTLEQIGEVLYDDNW